MYLDCRNLDLAESFDHTLWQVLIGPCVVFNVLVGLKNLPPDSSNLPLVSGLTLSVGLN